MKNCIVIIDVQNGFMTNRDTKKLPSKIIELLKNKKFDYIVATKFINKKGGPYDLLMGWHGLMDDKSIELSSEISKITNKIFEKNIYSCFNDEFLNYIDENKIGKLYFVGIDTDCCVLKSATDCFERNIPFKVLINYCASNGGESSQEAAIKVLTRMIGKQNMDFNI